jgi:Zn-dependent membrane protease YugP
MIQKTLDKAVNFPQESNVTGTVKAQLNIDENGKVTVEEINGQPELTAHVAKQLRECNFSRLQFDRKNLYSQIRF